MWKLCVHKVSSDPNSFTLELIEALHDCRRGWPNLCLASITDSQIAVLTARQAKRYGRFYGPVVVAADVVLSVVQGRFASARGSHDQQAPHWAARSASMPHSPRKATLRATGPTKTSLGGLDPNA
jgi:hypothetical protein